MINLRHTVSLFVVACAAAGVSAQTGDVMLQDSIAEIVVTGTGTEHLAGKAPVHTEVITSKDLESYAGRGLEDIISGLCSSIDFSSGDMGSNIRLNGLGNDYILIMVDNKRLNGLFHHADQRPAQIGPHAAAPALPRRNAAMVRAQQAVHRAVAPHMARKPAQPQGSGTWLLSSIPPA